MLDIETKVDGVSTMAAAEMNSIVDELENAITTAGQTLSGINVEQIAESMARYSAGGGLWYADSGTADNYVLASVLAFITPKAYFEGMVVGCVANTTSTAAGSQINVNGIGVVSLKDASGAALVANSIVAGTAFFARYDSGAVEFRFTNQSGIASLSADPNPTLAAVLDTGGFSISESEGAAVASTATPDIWAGDGGTLHITGTTTITTFQDAPRVGTWQKVIFDAALTLTDGSGLTLPGGDNISTEADDFAFIYAEAVDAFKVIYFRADGSGVFAATKAQQEAAASTTAFVAPATQQDHPSSAKAWVSFNGSATLSINSSFNVSSVVDDGTGLYTINFATDFADTDYSFCGVSGSTSLSYLMMRTSVGPTVGAAKIQTVDNTTANTDADKVGMAFFGEQ